MVPASIRSCLEELLHTFQLPLIKCNHYSSVAPVCFNLCKTAYTILFRKNQQISGVPFILLDISVTFLSIQIHYYLLQLWMCLVRDHLAGGEVQSCHVSGTAPEPLEETNSPTEVVQRVLRAPLEAGPVCIRKASVRIPVSPSLSPQTEWQSRKSTAMLQQQQSVCTRIYVSSMLPTYLPV